MDPLGVVGADEGAEEASRTWSRRLGGERRVGELGGRGLALDEADVVEGQTNGLAARRRPGPGLVILAKTRSKGGVSGGGEATR